LAEVAVCHQAVQQLLVLLHNLVHLVLYLVLLVDLEGNNG
jgi:hypothetical protein